MFRLIGPVGEIVKPMHLSNSEETITTSDTYALRKAGVIDSSRNPSEDAELTEQKAPRLNASIYPYLDCMPKRPSIECMPKSTNQKSIMAPNQTKSANQNKQMSSSDMTSSWMYNV